MKKKLIAGMALLFLFILVISVSDSGDTASTASSTPKVSVSRGSEGYLRSSTADIAVMRTPEILNEFVKAAVTKDVYGQNDILLNDSNSFFVPAGTKVLVTDKTMTTVKVRILEGKRIGETGWVPTEFVKPN